MNKVILILFFCPIICFGQSDVRLEYWDNGRVLSQTHYKRENRDGSQRGFYKSGKLMCRGFYKNVMMAGIWMTFYEINIPS